MFEKKSAKGSSLPKRNGSSPGTSPNEKSQAEARQLAVEAVTKSCSSLESSSKSEREVWMEVIGTPRTMGSPWMEEGPEL